MYLRTIDLKVQVLGPAHPSTIRTTQRLATMYTKQKPYPEAEAQLIRAYEALARAGASGRGEAPVAGLQAAVINQLVEFYDSWDSRPTRGNGARAC